MRGYPEDMKIEDLTEAVKKSLNMLSYQNTIIEENEKDV